MDAYLGRANFLHKGNVEGTFRLVAHSDEFAYDERVAVDFIEIAISAHLGLCSAKGQDVRNDAFITALCRVVNGGVGCSAVVLNQAFQDGAWAPPGGRVLGSPVGRQDWT